MGASQRVAVYGDNQNDLHRAITAVLRAGKVPEYVTVRARLKSYDFSVYAQLLRTQHALIVRSYGSVFAFRISDTTVGMRGMPPGIAPLIPFVDAPYVEKLATNPHVRTGVFGFGNTIAKSRHCPDCLMVLTNHAKVIQLGRHWNSLKDSWQVAQVYTPWAPAPQLKIGGGSCPPGSSGGSYPTSPPGSSPGGSGSSGPHQQACHPNSSGLGGGSSGGGSGSGKGNKITNAHKIFNEAKYFYSQKWSSANGPDGGNLACAYMVNQILQDAIDQTFDTVSVPSMESALENSSEASQVSQADSQEGDIIIQGDDGHVGICADAGCTAVYSNSSSQACFCWLSGPGFGQSGLGSPPSRIYHVGGP